MYCYVIIIIVIILLFILLLILNNKKCKKKCSFGCFISKKKEYFTETKEDQIYKIDEIKQFVIELRTYILKKINGNMYNPQHMKMYKRLIKKLNVDKIYPSKNNETYSKNKGKKIVVCTKYRTFNMAKYVIMHELAHIMNKTYGHNKSFWCLFKKILNEAIEGGLYMPIDYRQQPQKYCGKVISENILFTNLDCSKY